MSERIAELRSQVEAKRRDADVLLKKGEMTPDEIKTASDLSDDIDRIVKQMDEFREQDRQKAEIRARLESTKSILDRPVRELPFTGGDVKSFRIESGDSEVDRLASTGGFKNLGHFAYALVARGRHGERHDAAAMQLKKWQDIQPQLVAKERAEMDRLGLKAPSGMFEESDPDGGDLVPREFSNKIYERMMTTNQILPYLAGLPVTGNTLTIPALKEDSRVDGSRHGGVLGYWEGEADQYQSSSPKFRNISMKLHKLTVLTYVTEELLADSAVALESYLGRLVPKEINFKINDAVINGSGAGIPQGILNANSKVTVTAVSGQGASTIIWQNIADMWMRAIAGQRSTAIWLYNQDCESALVRLYMATGTAAGVAIFSPNAEDGAGIRLMGRPALVMEQCATRGTEGDIILFCPEGYACILKGGIQSFMSMHLRFDYDEYAYKWRFRMDGQMYDDVALTPANGSNTVSSVVTLSSTRT